MATFNGIGISFGIGTLTGLTLTGKLQTAEDTQNAEVEAVRDETGSTVNRTFYDANSDATFEYIVTAASPAAADQMVATGVPAPGTIVTITSVATANCGNFNGMKMSIESGAKRTRSNTGAVRVTLPLKYFPNITATV